MADILGLLEPGNIDLNTRPVVKNPDGSISTVRSMSVNIDGKEVLIPTVSDEGKVLEPNAAIELFMKTGRHLGKFDLPANATAYADKLHNEQAKQYLLLPFPQEPKAPGVELGPYMRGVQ